MFPNRIHLHWGLMFIAAGFLSHCRGFGLLYEDFTSKEASNNLASCTPHSAEGPYFPQPSFSSDVLTETASLPYKYLAQLLVGFCFPNCSESISIFPSQHLLQVNWPWFHLLHVSFLCLSFTRNSLFIHANLLPPSLDFPHVRMDWSWTWRRWS